MEQTVELTESTGEAQPPGIAKRSASTEPGFAVSSGEDGSFGSGKFVGEAWSPELAKHSYRYYSRKVR